MLPGATFVCRAQVGRGRNQRAEVALDERTPVQLTVIIARLGPAGPFSRAS